MIRPSGLTSRGLLWGFLLGFGAALFLLFGAGSASADEQSSPATAPSAAPNSDTGSPQGLLGSTVDKVLGSVAQPVKKVLKPVDEIGSAANNSAPKTTQGMSPKTGQNPTEKPDTKSQHGTAAPKVNSASTTEGHTNLAPQSDADGTHQGQKQGSTQGAEHAVSNGDPHVAPTNTTAETTTSARGSAATNTTRTSDAIGNVLDGVVTSVVTPLVDDSVSLVVDPVVEPLTERVVGPLVDDVVAPVVRHTIAPVVRHTIAPVVGHAVAPIVDGTHKTLGTTPHVHSVVDDAMQTHPIKHAVKRGEPAPRQTVQPRPDRAPTVDSNTAPLSFHTFQLPPGWVSSPMPSPAPPAPQAPQGMGGSAGTVLFQPPPGTATMRSDLRDVALIARMGRHDTFQDSLDAALPETSPG